MSAAYYNEIDPFAAQWLRNLIAAGHISPGEVDERDIRDVQPSDLDGFTRVHLFAGIGVWDYALQLAGWPAEEPVWTGSCPCQSFSGAGKRKGFDDERHLWPEMFRLLRQRRPVVCFGEQVAGGDGLAWLDLVRADLEGAGYACGAVDSPAAGYGAPQISQRLYWVATACGAGLPGRPQQSARKELAPSKRSGESGGMAATLGPRQCGGDQRGPGEGGPEVAEPEDRQDTANELGNGSEDATRGFWADADWLWCRDESYRPVEPGTFPLVNGSPARVGRLRGYGNAIVAPQAAEFVKAFMGLEI